MLGLRDAVPAPQPTAVSRAATDRSPELYERLDHAAGS